MKARQRISEILRIMPGSSLVVAPCDSDLAAPELAAGLEETFGGGGYTAPQRAALLQLAADHVSSALDGRESAFELHASGGMPVWRGRLRRAFPSYNELANAVLQAIDLPMPEIDVTAHRRRPARPAPDQRAGRIGRQGIGEIEGPSPCPLSPPAGGEFRLVATRRGYKAGDEPVWMRTAACPAQCSMPKHGEM